MASVAALDLRWGSDADPAALCELLYATLDEFDPHVIHEHESEDGWRVFFRTPTQRDDAVAALRRSFPDRLMELTAVDVPDDEWARRSQANLTAVRVGRIVVAPPWDTVDSRPSAVDSRPSAVDSPPELVIVIDPSTGFGTGHHETTRLCLSLLQELDLAGARVIDAGTGSGVLAIAASRLGAASVIAFDEDPDALRNADENVARSAQSSVTLLQVDLASVAIAPPADVVTANLTSAVLQKYADRLAGLVKPGGSLIVSGFAPAELADVAAAFGVAPVRAVSEGDWTAALLTPTARRTQS